VSLRKWFERAYIYWLAKSWWGFFERHRLLALLLPVASVTAAVTFITVTGLLVVADAAVALVRALVGGRARSARGLYI
jgi:5,10-methenyltetrahydromethanopterin hydrogenase